MQRARLILAAALGATALAVSACGADDDTDTAAPKGGAAKTDEPIIIGDIGAKAGWSAYYDGFQLRGAELAIKELNDSGGVLGRQLKIINFNNQSKPELSHTLALEAIDKGAVALITSSDFDLGGPGALVAGQKDVPAIGPAAGDPNFGVQGIGPLAFTVSSATNNTGALLAEFAYEEMGWRTTWVLEDVSLQYGKSLREYFMTRWQELAGKDSVLGHETYKNDDQSIQAQIARLKALPKLPDFIELGSWLPGGGAAIKQIRAAGIDVPILTTENFDGDLFFDTVPKNVKDVYALSYAWLGGGDVDPKANELVEKYKSTFGEAPESPTFVLGYAAIHLLAKGMTECKCTEGPGVVKVMNGLKDLEIGPLSITYSDAIHNPISLGMVVWKAVNGKREYVTTYRPKKVPPAKFG